MRFRQSGTACKVRACCCALAIASPVIDTAPLVLERSNSVVQALDHLHNAAKHILSCRTVSGHIALPVGGAAAPAHPLVHT